MRQQELNKSNIVAFLADIFQRRGAESYLGEDVTMAEHMLQGAMLAEKENAPDELVVAALLHDIGHYTSEFGVYSPEDTEDNYHDAAGGRVLRPYFPQVVTQCVALHVRAKRYLCAVDPDYMGKLSEASVHSLSLQGGPMQPEEVSEFEQQPFYKEALKVRIWDDEGKVAGVKTKNFNDYKAVIQRVVES